MAVASDSHRLKLLREVAGTRVYDERREESVTILKETVGKVEKINEFLQTIEERLKTLEEEKEELKEYQRWDRARRVLEFIVHDTEHRENKRKLEELEKLRTNSGKEQQHYADMVREAQDHVREANRKLKEARKEVAAAREEKDILSTEQQQLLREKTKLELAIKDLTDDVDGDNKSKERAEAELERLRQQISEKERELEELKPRYEEMKAREEECTRALALNQQKRQELYAKQGRGTQFTSKQDRDRWIEKELKALALNQQKRQELYAKQGRGTQFTSKQDRDRWIEKELKNVPGLNQQKRQELYAKQGRGTQFTSKQDRDRWIEKELKSLNKQIKDKKDHEVKLREDLKRDGVKVGELETRLEDLSKECERQRLAIDEHNKHYYECKKKKDQEQSTRKSVSHRPHNKHYYECKKKKDQEQSTRNELWRKETSLTQNLTSLKDDLAKADQALRSMAGKPILNGRDSVRKVLDTFTERGGEWARIATQYYGPVIENFSCDKTIYTAVEVTAGNRLFHHIVESDTVGTKILKEMNRQSLPGEVTFMPLNRLQVRDMVYPNDNNAIAMVQKLKYDPKYAKAMKYIFGKTLICRNLECATELGKQFHLDCVTLEGDQYIFSKTLICRNLECATELSKQFHLDCVVMLEGDQYIFGKTLICRNLECATELGKQFHLDCVTLEGDQSFSMKYIFGKTLICRNLECATELGKQFHLDCVTLEGDQVSSKGSLTGGYFNQSRSRLEMQKTRSELMEQITTLEQELSTLRQELSKTEASINQIVSEMQRTETKQGKAKSELMEQITTLEQELSTLRQELSKTEASINQIVSEMQRTETKQGKAK
ncbi:SMC proteins flexible hinge domain-containing protein [Phthorimaea operculella]|nr:SMC proteins flexible hinge domain-containing protein [Phthorimaea operculella]